jgi:hypothetical protein
MRIKLLLLVCVSVLLVDAQEPINNYFSAPMSEYALVSGTIDQTPTGANATWSFSGLIKSGTNTDTFAAPSAQELSTYPGTTQVLTITDDAMNTNQAFYKIVGATLSLTGASNPQFTLDYNTDNAEIGTYPLIFGAAVNNDAIAGEINAQGQTEDYDGIISTEVDAYGELTYDVLNEGGYSGDVTRIRTEQDLSFTVAGFFPGTASIISYNYYRDDIGDLVFRTTAGVVSVPDLGITESFSSAEGVIVNVLSVENNSLAINDMKLYPNPAEDFLNIQFSNNTISIKSVKITDINGRTILTAQSNSALKIGQLQSGFYTISVSTNKGSVVRKFIKK